MSKQTLTPKKAHKILLSERKKIRTAVANYMQSEGCGCCSDDEMHYLHKVTLATLLKVPKYSDGSGYDFSKFKDEK